MFRKIFARLIITLLAVTLVACSASLPSTGAVAPATPETSTGAPSTVTSPPAASSKAAPSEATAIDVSNVAASQATDVTYPIVDTGQVQCYAANGAASTCPAEGSALFGQDAQYTGQAPRYTNNRDGTITDDVTGLTWQQSPDTNGDGVINAADKLTYDQAVAGASTLNLAGYTDWRLPTIQELYSLILFDGVDPSGLEGGSNQTLIPFIDTDYFDFAYGDTGAGERLIDAQFASSTIYVASTMNGIETMFGVNFADGRIKGYGLSLHGQEKTFYVLYVRGNPSYGENSFVDNANGTISDHATGLMWQQNDSGSGMVWADALAYCQNLTLAGYGDWRLPDAKELQSIVDYTRSPDTTASASIDPLFNVTVITNEAGQADYPFYWSSTTHANLRNGMNAAYVAFGRSLGYMNGAWVDVHGAGSQRSDPKSGDPNNYPTGHGPQGDAIRIYNYARCVRGGDVALDTGGGVVTGRTGMTVESTVGEQPSQSDGHPPTGEPPALPDDPATNAPSGRPAAAGQASPGDARQPPPPTKRP